MPEFGEYLSGLDGLRLAVATKTPRELGLAFRAYRTGEYDMAKVEELIKAVVNLVLDHHGPMGAAEFMQEAMR